MNSEHALLSRLQDSYKTAVADMWPWKELLFNVSFLSF